MAEILDLRRALGNYHPLIAENGGLVAIPENYFTATFDAGAPETYIWPRLMGPTAAQIVKLLQQLREEFGYTFEGFADWDVERVAAETGLTTDQAMFARQRLASEPIRWLDTPERRETFTAQLTEYHLRTVRGGRFDHVVGNQADKASAMQYLLDMYAEREAEKLPFAQS